MRYFLILLLGVVPFFAPAQVVLPDSVASFYLNRHFLADNLQKTNELLNLLVENKNQTIQVKDEIIVSLSNDYKTHQSIIDTYKKETFILQEEAKILKKKVKAERTKTFACLLGSIALILFL